jgi:excisionase family DNA binding protein
LSLVARTLDDEVSAITAETVADFLHERGLPVPESELVATLRQFLDAHLGAPAAAALPVETADFLHQHSGVVPGDSSVTGAAGQAVAATATLAQTSLSVQEAAELLGVHASRVRHRIADGAVHAVRVGRANRLPAWQFNDGHLLSGLSAVLGALPAGLHPLEVEGFFMTPQPELSIGGTVRSSRDWLIAAGDPKPVVELAQSLDAQV